MPTATNGWPKSFHVILEDAGLQVWDATREIMPGDNWAATLGNALQEAQAMVVLVTPDAMRSKWVRWEIEYALGQIRFRERLIPVVTGALMIWRKKTFPGFCAG